MQKVGSKVLDVLKEKAAKEPLVQVSEAGENDSASKHDPSIYNDSKESYYKRPIGPWPMPCRDGNRMIHLPDRGTVIRSTAVGEPDSKEKVKKLANPYILPESRPERKPQNYGFPRYRMVTLPIPTKRLVCTDKNGNKFQLAPTPRYHPFE